MSFDEEPPDPHGECAAEIHRLETENADLRKQLTDETKALRDEKSDTRQMLSLLMVYLVEYNDDDDAATHAKRIVRNWQIALNPTQEIEEKPS